MSFFSFWTEFDPDAIMARLRNGVQPSVEDAIELKRLPGIQALRDLVIEADLTWIGQAVLSQSGAVAALYVGLVDERLGAKPEIRDVWLQRWDTADTHLRAHLIYRIADDPDLPLVWHQRLFDWVMDNWAVFRDESLAFIGSSETVVPEIRKRLENPDYFPPSKRWLLLCRLPEVSNDEVSARLLIEAARATGDPFIRQVADRLLRRFF